MSSVVAWVDGVGAVLLIGGDRLTLGGPPRRGRSADLPLAAPLKPVHAAIERRGEGYAVVAMGGPAEVGGAGDGGAGDGGAGDGHAAERLPAAADASAPLSDDAAFALLEADGGGPGGAEPRRAPFRWRVPNPLSPTGVLTFPNDHRPAPGWGPVRIEAALLATGPAIFGPGTDAHVRVRDASATVLLRHRYDRNGAGGWEVRSAEPLRVARGGGRPEPAAAFAWVPLNPGDAATGAGFGLRLAAVAAPPA